jgi:hypothetical protein
MSEQAKAYPRKHFFIEMFTRDISLEDCVLDLIDNSIDGLIRFKQIDLSGNLLKEHKPLSPKELDDLPKIEITYNSKGNQFKIQDACGGITRKHAQNEIFNFGHAEGDVEGTLGVYGIGLKRAIFKLGNVFNMESKTVDEGFAVKGLNLKKWAEKDDDIKDWVIPLTFIPGSASKTTAGTTITMTELRPEVIMRMDDGTFDTLLYSTISQSYSLFLNKYVHIILNGTTVSPFPIPLGQSLQVTPAHDEYQARDVKVSILASLAQRNAKGEWPLEPAGWYVLCNGRIVVAANKTELTGWDTPGCPAWHNSKHRGFVGIVLFQSPNALSLPWTTTKRGLNRESAAYINARNRMKGVAKPILSFLDRMYKNEVPEEIAEREIAADVKSVSLSSIASKPQTQFKVDYTHVRTPKTTVRVQYDAEMSALDRIRKKLNKSSLGAGKVGKFTFDYYLKTECPK